MQRQLLTLIVCGLLAVPWTNALAGPLDGASPSPSVAERHTPFVAALLRNWSRWDTNNDGILSAAEVDAAVADPAVRHDDAAAAAALKLALRSTKVTLPPLTREYFTLYDQKAISSSHTKTGAQTEDDRSDSNDLSTAASGPADAKGVSINWDRSYSRCLRRIARLGGATPWPTDPATSSSIDHMSQGPLGDCFFVATLGTAVIHRPNLLRDFIHVLPDGRYQATFPNARPIPFGPVTDAQVALSSTSEGDGAWLAVMEQAYGKYRSELKGNSLDVDGTDVLRRGGDSSVTIRLLTGHATHRISLPVSIEQRKAEEMKLLPELREALTSACAEHRLITAGVDPPASSPAPLPTLPPGINKKHVYAIVSYDPATDTVEIWNPHGQTFHPKGAPGLENGYITEHGRFKLPLVEAYRFYTSFTFELSAGPR